MPLRECLWLIKNGIREDTAFALNEITRCAWSIVFAELSGQTFDRKTMTFKETNSNGGS